MRFVLSAFVALAAPAAASDKPSLDPSGTPAAGCPEADIHRVERGQPLRAYPLTEEPGARREIAVLHTEDGCVKPIVVGEDIGGSSPAR